jgi:hypothetical protein
VAPAQKLPAAAGSLTPRANFPCPIRPRLHPQPGADRRLAPPNCTRLVQTRWSASQLVCELTPVHPRPRSTHAAQASASIPCSDANASPSVLGGAIGSPQRGTRERRLHHARACGASTAQL